MPTRTATLTIERHMLGGVKELIASASVEVEEDANGNEDFGEVTYSVAHDEEVRLSIEEKTALNAELGIFPDMVDSLDQDDEISEEDFEDANPEEDEEEQEDTKA